MDRWHIDSSDPTIDLPLNVMNNYFSIGVDAAACLKFHSERGRVDFYPKYAKIRDTGFVTFDYELYFLNAKVDDFRTISTDLRIISWLLKKSSSFS